MRWLPALLLVPALVRAGDPPAPGSVVDQTTVTVAEPFLAPEVTAHYRAGEYRNTVAAWPAGAPWGEGFAAASATNAARLAVDRRGTIVERGSGAPVRGLYGLPFRIDAADPSAGVQVIWNAYYALWRLGSVHDVLGLEWIGKRGLERQAGIETHMLYWEGVPPAMAPTSNPKDLASQGRAFVSSPADLHGTVSLTWRFRAADAEDQSWTYVPALRRVRQVSPTNRSDGFLGSDLSLDDGAFFDGKPEAFTWKLVGERDVLALADPASLAGTATRRVRPDGGFEDVWPSGQAVVGHQDRAWTGLAWAPVGPVLAKRRVWVVEATPADPYYLFARIEIGIDQDTFQGVFSRKFDAQGVLLRSLQFLTFASHPVTLGGEDLRLPTSSMGYVLAENTKQGRATVVGTTPPGVSVHERRIPIDAGVFALESLGTGK